MREVFSFARNFPDLGIRSASLRKYWKYKGAGAGQYATMALLISFLAGLAAAAILMGFGALFSGGGFFAIFALAFFILARLPESAEKARLARMETQLPLFLRTFGMLLDMKIPFGQALAMAARHGEAGEEFSAAVAESESGIGLSKALAKVAERNESAEVKKAVAQLISAYEHGARGEEVRRIADDLISMQRYRLRDFVSKSSFFGLLFVIFSAIVPALFLVFATAGKFALGFEISAGQFAAVFLLVFPLASGAMLLVSRAQMPPSAFGSGKRGNYLVFLAFAALVALVMASGLGAAEKFGASAVLGIGFAALLWDEQKETGRLEKIEEALPNSLLGVSGLPKNYGLEKVFERMASAGDAFSPEAEKTLRQLRTNVSADKALLGLWQRNDSFMLRRLGELMLDAQNSGANVSEKMHEMAEDLLRFAELRRERENALSMQKYTLLLGALVVPLILSVSLGVVSQMASFLEGANAEVLGVAAGTITAYMVIYSALSAFYIADSEAKQSRAGFYFLGMALLGWTSIYIISTQFA